MAAYAPNHWPPSENETGVTFTTPMTRQRSGPGSPGGLAGRAAFAITWGTLRGPLRPRNGPRPRPAAPLWDPPPALNHSPRALNHSPRALSRPPRALSQLISRIWYRRTRQTGHLAAPTT